MKPSEESPLWKEIKLLREELEHANERHWLAMDNIRDRIAEIEGELSGVKPDSGAASAQQRSEPGITTAATPPPLPKTEQENKPAHMPALKEARLKPEPEPTEPKPVAIQASPHPAHAPSPTAPPQPKSSFELDFGKVWFVRIGIVILLTGLVFLGNYAYQNWIREMPNGVRLAALFACALALVETGRQLAKKESLHRFGEVLLAGGMAFFYYCTFASHHVERLRVIESAAFGAILLSAAALAIAAVSWLRKAKATAILGIVLASYATMLQPIGWMSCFSNLLLGGLGLFFMLRPGWSGPGWASMLGSYGAFLGWQLLGASGGNFRSEDPATLWFLPPLWVMFAIPGTVGRFREALSDRARAWFTALNNAFFFLLFSGVWLHQNGDDDYWKVAAVFGTVLIALGILGRRQNATAGGVNIGQGIAIATFAIILKLDGQNLALVLAFESLALAIAAWKFHGKSEAAFSLLAGIGAALLTTHDTSIIPVWSAGVVAALLAAASAVAIRIKNTGELFVPFVRFSAAALFVSGAVVASHLCLWRLEQPQALLAAIAVSGVASLATLKLDPKRRQPEIAWTALWFLGISGWLGLFSNDSWPLWVAATVSLAACWMWHRQPEPVRNQPSADLARFPSLPAWAYSLAVPFLAFVAMEKSGIADASLLTFNEAAALVIAAFAIGLRCKRLLAASAALALFGLEFAVRDEPGGNLVLFIAAFIALVPAAMIRLPWSRERLDGIYATVSSWIFRATAFIAYCAAWQRFSPDNWSDWLALTSIALTLAILFLKRKLLPESVALAAVAVVAFANASITSPWHLSPGETGWRGITVVIALLSLVLTYRQRPALITSPEIRATAIAGIAGLTCFVTTVWATQMLVWRFGWKPAAVLWTVLGFGFVSGGLWQRLHILRVSGFMLLVISLGKLFAVDVWDFTAFMRVVSFIVLGAALILLGLFYNKFAEAIKALLDDERGAND